MGLKRWLNKITSNTTETESKGLAEPVQAVPTPPAAVKKPRKPRPPKQPKETKPVGPAIPVNAEKELATQLGEPWVTVTGIDLDIDNIGTGAFSLDWNDIFVARLVKAGYRGKDDIQIVDQWFNSVCRSVLEENWEQNQADPTNRQK